MQWRDEQGCQTAPGWPSKELAPNSWIDPATSHPLAWPALAGPPTSSFVMPKLSVVVYVLASLALFVADPRVTRAQAEEREKDFPDPVERFLKSAPASAIRKLKEPATAAAGATELNRYFSKSAINKWVTVHTKAETVDPTPNGRNAARIRAESIPLERDGVTMARLSWLYFPEANAPRADDVKPESEIRVYGQVRRCEVVVTDSGVRFDFDLWKAKVEGR